MIFDYFGGCEFGSEKPTCDLFRYIEENKNTIFKKMSSKEKEKFIYNVMA